MNSRQPRSWRMKPSQLAMGATPSAALAATSWMRSVERRRPRLRRTEVFEWKSWR